MILQIFALSIPQGVEWLLVFVVLIFLYFWVKTIIEILKREMPVTNKIAWLLIVFFTGILGLVIYTQKIVYTDWNLLLLANITMYIKNPAQMNYTGFFYVDILKPLLIQYLNLCSPVLRPALFRFVTGYGHC